MPFVVGLCADSMAEWATGCDDGRDNDGDGLVDAGGRYPTPLHPDPGCTDPADESE